MKYKLCHVAGALSALTMAASAAFASPPTVSTIPIGTLFDSCTGEAVAFNGDQVIKVSAAVRNDIAHVITDIRAHATGVGQTTGAKYLLDYEVHQVQNVKIVGGAGEFNAIVHQNVIAPGKLPNSMVTESVHFTVKRERGRYDHQDIRANSLMPVV